MASDTVPAAVPGPGPTAGATTPDTGTTTEPGGLTGLLSAPDPARPAPAGFDLHPAGSDASADQAVTGASSATYHPSSDHNDPKNATGNGGGNNTEKNSSTPPEGVLKTWLRTGAEVWKKSADARLEAVKAEKARASAVKTTETVNRSEKIVGGDTSNRTVAEKNQATSTKAEKKEPGKDPAGGKGGTGLAGANGQGKQAPAGGRQAPAGGGDKGKPPGKTNSPTAPGPAGRGTAGGGAPAPKPAPAPKNPPAPKNGGTGTHPGGKGAGGSAQQPKNPTPKHSADTGTQPKTSPWKDRLAGIGGGKNNTGQAGGAGTGTGGTKGAGGVQQPKTPAPKPATAPKNPSGPTGGAGAGVQQKPGAWKNLPGGAGATGSGKPGTGPGAASGGGQGRTGTGTPPPAQPKDGLLKKLPGILHKQPTNGPAPAPKNTPGPKNASSGPHAAPKPPAPVPPKAPTGGGHAGGPATAPKNSGPHGGPKNTPTGPGPGPAKTPAPTSHDTTGGRLRAALERAVTNGPAATPTRKQNDARGPHAAPTDLRKQPPGQAPGGTPRTNPAPTSGKAPAEPARGGKQHPTPDTPRRAAPDTKAAPTAGGKAHPGIVPAGGSTLGRGGRAQDKTPWGGSKPAPAPRPDGQRPAPVNTGQPKLAPAPAPAGKDTAANGAPRPAAADRLRAATADALRRTRQQTTTGGTGQTPGRAPAPKKTPDADTAPGKQTPAGPPRSRDTGTPRAPRTAPDTAPADKLGKTGRPVKGPLNDPHALDKAARGQAGKKPTPGPVPPKPTVPPKPATPPAVGTGKPLDIRGSRETGYRDGARLGRVAAHVNAYRDGIRDGHTAIKEDAERQKRHLDQAHQQRKQQRQKDPTVTTPTSADYHRQPREGITAPDAPQPVTVTEIDASGVYLGGDARAHMARGEVRSLANFQHQLKAKTDIMDRVAENTRGLQQQAADQAAEITQTLESFRGVQGSEKVLSELAKLQEAAKAQESQAIEVEQRGVRAAEACKTLSANVATRYDGIYQAVVNSCENETPESNYFRDLGITRA